MKPNFEKILNDNSISDILCSTNFMKIMLHKELYKDRFIILYAKNYKEKLEQENLLVSGYYDTKENVIYNISDNLKELLPDDSKIKLESFYSLNNKIFKEIDEYVSKYILENPDRFKDAAIEQTNYEDNWRMKNYRSDVEREFINKAAPSITLEDINSSYKIGRENYYYDNTLLEEYLFNPKETIEKYSKILMEKETAELGLKLLYFEAKKEYLEKILENKDNRFEHIYTNKKILDSLKPVDARSVNVKIRYGDKELTFKYEYDSLTSSLSSGSLKTNSYGQSYSRVRDFFSDNEIRNEEGRIETNFSFANIISITHGKNVLYTNESLVKDIEKDDYEEEIER